MARTTRRLRWTSAPEQAADPCFAQDRPDSERRFDVDRRFGPPAPESARRRQIGGYDPRDISGRRAQSPYEANYDVAHGYTYDRSIVLP